MTAESEYDAVIAPAFAAEPDEEDEEIDEEEDEETGDEEVEDEEGRGWGAELEEGSVAGTLIESRG